MATIERRRLKRGISFRVEWRHAGARHRLTFDTEQDATEWKHLIEAAGGDPDRADRALLGLSSKAPLLSEVAAEHISRLIDVAPYGKAKYDTHIRHHLTHLDMPVDQITEDDIARWVAWMSNDAPVRGRTEPGYAPKTIHNAHGFLSAVLTFAVKRGYRASNPAHGTRLPQTDTSSDGERFLTAEEVGALMPHIAERYQPYARFLFATGLRAGEMLALLPEDFTVAQGVVQVRISKAMTQDADGVGVHVGMPKTRRSRRTLDVDEGTMEHVWPLIRAAGHGNVVFPAGTTQATTRLRQNMIEGAQTRAARAGFSKHFGLHTFRHSHAAHMLALGMPIHELSWRLGHSSIQVTIDRYGHLVPSRMGSASRLFAEGTPALTAAPAKALGAG